jgi:phosphatidylserine/phosphatidylglycerophosphate/cardiolipin synthase-like enzyme
LDKLGTLPFGLWETVRLIEFSRNTQRRRRKMVTVAATPQKRKLRSIFGFSEDRAIVIGLPNDFSFQSAVAGATRIRLATAFAHLTGWHLIKSAILGSSAHTQLLTGLAFFQTEPKLLREWSRLTVRDESQPQIEARLAPKVTTFHPKILIVSSAVNFAVVGSGNISFGGLRSNTECSLYTEDYLMVASLIDWFDDEWQRANALSHSDIGNYERRYKKLLKARGRANYREESYRHFMGAKRGPRGRDCLLQDAWLFKGIRRSEGRRR